MQLVYQQFGDLPLKFEIYGMLCLDFNLIFYVSTKNTPHKTVQA